MVKVMLKPSITKEGKPHGRQDGSMVEVYPSEAIGSLGQILLPPWKGVGGCMQVVLSATSPAFPFIFVVVSFSIRSVNRQQLPLVNENFWVWSLPIT